MHVAYNRMPVAVVQIGVIVAAGAEPIAEIVVGGVGRDVLRVDMLERCDVEILEKVKCEPVVFSLVFDRGQNVVGLEYFYDLLVVNTICDAPERVIAGQSDALTYEFCQTVGENRSADRLTVI